MRNLPGSTSPSATAAPKLEKGILGLETESIFYRCVEDSSDAIMISDCAGRLVYVNPAWCAIYGYSQEEAIGQTPRLLHSGAHSAEFYRQMWDQISDPSRGFWKGELTNRARNGRLVPVLLTITPFRTVGEQIEGYMGIAVDVSAKKELEAKVLRQDRLASIGLLASGLAHEIGTPLGVMRGRSELLLEKMTTEHDRKSLEIILGQIDRISGLIQSLLGLSRGTVSKPEIQSVSVRTGVENVLALLGAHLRKDGIECTSEIAPAAKVRADRTRLEQILLNFLMNAIQAIQMTDASVLQANGRRIQVRTLTRFLGNDFQIGIQVSDSGQGILKENLSKLFQPFFTTKDVGQGTGLGLPIALGLAHEMHGEIDVESEWGKGATFTVWLPGEKESA